MELRHQEPKTQEVAGRYRLMRVLGRGAFATCYLASEQGTDRRSVVKIAHDYLVRGAHADDLRERFAAEVRAATRVAHPSIATVYTAGETAQGLPFIAMEFVDGEPIHKALQQTSPWDARAIWEIFGQLLDALAVIHDAGIVHRDVSPQNVLLTPENRAVLLDFGVAHVDSGTGYTMGPLGTPRYMAPEQIEGIATPASDIFSLGCLLWWAVTGHERLAHVGNVGKLLAHRLRATSAPDPRDVMPFLSDDMAETLMAMLHPEPEARPTAQQLIARWDDLCDGWFTTQQRISHQGTREADAYIEIEVNEPEPEPEPEPSSTTRPFRCLLLSENRAFLGFLSNICSGLAIEHVSCSSRSEAFAETERELVDVILLCSPGAAEHEATLDLLRSLRRNNINVPAFLVGLDGDVVEVPTSEALDIEDTFHVPSGVDTLRDQLVERLEAARSNCLDSHTVETLRRQGTLSHRVEFLLGIVPEFIGEFEDALERRDVIALEQAANQLVRAAEDVGCRGLAYAGNLLARYAPTRNPILLEQLCERVELVFRESFQALHRHRSVR